MKAEHPIQSQRLLLNLLGNAPNTWECKREALDPHRGAVQAQDRAVTDLLQMASYQSGNLGQEAMTPSSQNCVSMECERSCKRQSWPRNIDYLDSSKAWG